MSIFDKRAPLRRGGAVGRAGAGGGALLISMGAALAGTYPAGAAAMFAAVQSAFTCAATGTTSCLSGTNTSSGIGVLGASNTGTGIRGTSNTNNGVKGTSKTNYGVFGQSASNVSAGVAGTAPTTGVFGTSTGTLNGAGIGVVGSSPTGMGALAHAGDGVGLGGFADSGNGVVASSGSDDGVVTSSNAGTGLNVFSGSTAATGANPAIDARGFIALGADSRPKGFSLVLTDLRGDRVFSVDGVGNVRFAGTFTRLMPARATGAAAVTAFAPKTTQPALEDTGTAHLINGAATIRLEPNFAASIDSRSAYRVFLTPHGDTRGLYTALKSPTGFVVRESQGGRTTLDFDYRILATPWGGMGQRMTLVPGGIPRLPWPAGRPVESVLPPVAPTVP